MILSFALLAQAAVLASHPAPPAQKGAPVLVWRADSTVYVTLREPGHLVLLHVDAIGRIRMLFPLAPGDSTLISGDAPIAVSLPPSAQGNPSSFVAVRSRWPFEFQALQAGSAWDYRHAWLLQPTAGDPLAALLDIADRITDGRPYDYGQVTYSRRGAVVARGPAVQPDVCLTCYRHASAAAAPPTVATNNVDCTNASLTNSFCGVNSGSVSIASAPVPAPQVIYQPAPAPARVYVPYFVPITRGFRRPVEPFPMPPPPPPESHGVAFPIAPQLIVPSSSQLRTLAGRRP
jgi:hypothetical protein